jgi:uncharacterized protein (UPF0332 family)
LKLGDIAGRTAYLAGFHAAQALIFERRAFVPKTHRGVHGQFSDLVRTEPRLDAARRSFLTQAYKLKAVADCDTGPEADIPVAEAEQAIVVAKRFVATVDTLIREPT